MKKVFLSAAFALLMVINVNLYSQVAISNDGSAPSSSSMLDIKSTSSGLLVPRMTFSDRNSIANPANGLMIYQTDNTAGFYYYNGSSWVGMVSSTHYLGELFGGGVVFWVDQTGQHGLIVSMIDLSAGQEWSNVNATLIGSTSQSE